MRLDTHFRFNKTQLYCNRDLPIGQSKCFMNSQSESLQLGETSKCIGCSPLIQSDNLNEMRLSDPESDIVGKTDRLSTTLFPLETECHDVTVYDFRDYI